MVRLDERDIRSLDGGGSILGNVDMTPDLAARRVVVHSFLYYGLDTSLIEDSEFDNLCKIAADGWDQLDPARKKQLGSAAKIRTSGYHCKISRLGISVARSLLGPGVKILLPQPWFHRFYHDFEKPFLMPVSTKCSIELLTDTTNR